MLLWHWDLRLAIERSANMLYSPELWSFALISKLDFFHVASLLWNFSASELLSSWARESHIQWPRLWCKSSLADWMEKEMPARLYFNLFVDNGSFGSVADVTSFTWGDATSLPPSLFFLFSENCKGPKENHFCSWRLMALQTPSRTDHTNCNELFTLSLIARHYLAIE